MSEYHRICETCIHFDETQIYSHCCSVDIDTPLRYRCECADYEYDPDCADSPFCTENRDYSCLKDEYGTIHI